MLCFKKWERGKLKSAKVVECSKAHDWNTPYRAGSYGQNLMSCSCHHFIS